MHLYNSRVVDPDVARSRPIPSKGPARQVLARQIGSLPQLFARDLPVFVLLDGHRPPLINCVDDIGYGFEGKLM